MNKSTLFVALILLVSGCAAKEESQDLRTFIANAGMISIMVPSPDPLPPSPVPGGKCETCRGTGILGDGINGATCTKCNGTGVVPAKAVSDNNENKPIVKQSAVSAKPAQGSTGAINPTQPTNQVTSTVRVLEPNKTYICEGGECQIKVVPRQQKQ